MTKLYNISSDLKQALASYTENSEETQNISELVNMLNNKTESCVEYLKLLQDKSDLAKKRINELKEYKDIQDRKIENFKNYILMCLEFSGVEKIENGLSKIQIQKPRKKVNIIDESKLPIQFLEYSPKVKKSELKKALELGELIDGAELVDGNKSLKIK